MWLQSGLSCIWSSYALQTLQASVSHDSTRDADLLVLLIHLNDMMLSLRQAVNTPFKAVTLTLVYVLFVQLAPTGSCLCDKESLGLYLCSVIVFNPRRACARVTVVVLCVCVCVCVFVCVCLSVCPSVPALAASASVETSKQRYSRVSLRLFLD